MDFFTSGLDSAARNIFQNSSPSEIIKSDQVDIYGEGAPTVSFDELLNAIEKKDAESFKALLDIFDGNSMEKSREAHRLLHATVNSDHHGLTDILVNSRCGENLDFELIDMEGKNALTVAMEKENYRAADALLKKMKDGRVDEYIFGLAKKYGHLAMLTAGMKAGFLVSEKDLLAALEKVSEKSSGDVNVSDPEGTTLLMIAAEKGFKLVAEILLQNKADIHLVDKYGRNAMAYAVQSGNVDMVEDLRPAEIDDLFDALDWKKLEIFKTLLEKLDGKSINQLRKVGTIFQREGGTLLHGCIGKNRPEFFEALINSRHRNNIDLEVKDMSGDTAMIRAVKWDYDPKIVVSLVNLGANLDAVNRHSENLLEIAVSRYPYRDGITKALVDAGANANLRNASDGKTALFRATYAPLEIFRRLVDVGAHVKISDSLGDTPLHRGVVGGQVDIFEFLVRCMIKEGGDINAENKEGHTPLIMAIRRSRYGISEVLVRTAKEIGHLGLLFDAMRLGMNISEDDILVAVENALKDANGNINFRDKDGSTILIAATKKGFNRVVEFLLNKENFLPRKNGNLDALVPVPDLNKVDIHAVDNIGRNALMYAAQDGNLYILEMLRLANADLNATDNQGASAAVLAAQAGHLDAMAFFAARGGLF